MIKVLTFIKEGAYSNNKMLESKLNCLTSAGAGCSLLTTIGGIRIGAYEVPKINEASMGDLISGCTPLGEFNNYKYFRCNDEYKPFTLVVIEEDYSIDIEGIFNYMFNFVPELGLLTETSRNAFADIIVYFLGDHLYTAYRGYKMVSFQNFLKEIKNIGGYNFYTP